MDDFDELELNEDQEGDENKINTSKLSYKYRKLEQKLKKYEIILKNLESINRQSNPTKVILSRLNLYI
jgi:F0F1-type ATP synthase epsilon subunit